MGNRYSDTAAIVLKDCRIPRENLLGRDETIKIRGGGGFKGLMKTFNLTRPLVSARGIGHVLACHEFVTEEMKKKESKSIGKSGSTGVMLYRKN